MDKDRLEWVLSGINMNKCSKIEKDLVKKIQNKCEQPDTITQYEENSLEQIYRLRSR